MFLLVVLVRVFYYNLGQNIGRLFLVWEQFPFTTAETDLDYYHQELNVPVSCLTSSKKTES